MKEAQTKGNSPKMAFEPLKQTNQKLYTNENLSEHNKEVLEDFFRKARSGGSGEAILRDYASRFNKLAEHIDFELDNPSQKDLENLVAAFNMDEVKKNNGEVYSEYSKDKFWSTISKFYTWFIKKEGKGYNPDINGPELLEDLEIKIDISTEVDPDQKPTPQEVKVVAKQADNLRDKALILFLWATGARVGEVFITQHNDTPLKWKDLEFKNDKLWVELVDGKTGPRDVPVKISKPIMEEYWDSCSSNREDPVFKKRNATSICPKCSSELNLVGNGGKPQYKKYQCPSCEWKGNGIEKERKKKPLTANAVRRILRKLVSKAGLEGQFDDNPHDFGRKSRAIYKARVGYTEHQLRSFFGWSETGDAPKNYIQCVKEDLEKALAEEFGEKVEYQNGYEEEALRPVECVSCGAVNSATSDLCKKCGNGLTEQGEQLTKESGFQDLESSFIELLSQKDPAEDKEDIQKLMNKPAIELFRELAE